jgi:fatty acid desaturase
MGRKGGGMDESGSQFTPGNGETYEEDRRRRLHRDRLVGFGLCFALWGLSVIPLARESMHGREGAGAVAVYLVVGAITLGAAVLIRGVYTWLRKVHFWSPWVFLLAAVLALAGYMVQSAGPGGVISAPQPKSVLSEHGP